MQLCYSDKCYLFMHFGSILFDMGAIGATVVKDKSVKTHIADSDIDTEIALRYHKTKMKSRIH